MAKAKAMRLWERDGSRVWAAGVKEAVRQTGGWRGQREVKVLEMASNRTYLIRRDMLGRIVQEII